MADEIKNHRTEDYESLYSNSVQFETSAWDCKLIFGQLDQAASTIEQDTAITLPWTHAKITAYYFFVNILLHERQNGAIAIPVRVIPSRPDPNSAEVVPSEKPVVEYLRWVHDQMFGSDPYIPPAMQAALDALKSPSES